MVNSIMLCLFVLTLAALQPASVLGMKWDFGWSALVTGNVYCDQCLKQEVFPFARPLDGAKVSVQCYDEAGANVVATAEATTNFFGGYAVTFKGVSDLGGCKAFVTYSPDSSCNIADGGGQTLVLKTKFFFSAFYIVDPLYYKPSQPKDFCPGSHPEPPPFTFPPHPKPPSIPPSPPVSVPPFPWKTPSTCGYDEWLNSVFFCHWKNASPFQTTVGQMFGKTAQMKYGNMSLYDALQSQDDLLRQAVAAMMNSYTNLHFYMSPKAIKKSFNAAIVGTQQLQWDTAWNFKQANSGYGNGKCFLLPCKL